MLANLRYHKRAQRGIVLVLVLAMLGLLALIGVTFATFSGQARINARNFSQSATSPQDDELMDFALMQLITDTGDARSAIHGHSLARDMYGSDANANGYLPTNTSSTGPLFTIQNIKPVTVSGTTYYDILTNIPIPGSAPQYDSTFYGYNFTRWIMRLTVLGTPAVRPPDQTIEIIVDDNGQVANATSFSGQGFHAFRIATYDSTTGLTNLSTTPTPIISNPLVQPVAGIPFTLDGRWLRAFNGTGMGANAYKGNFRYNSLTPGSSGMDEDYDACDLENWFLAIQSADGQVVIPSFHRPGIVRYDPTNAVNDWNQAYRFPNGLFGGPNTDSLSRILRPVAADGHDQTTFPDLTPDPITGKITYDVDNDGDGVTDSVWLDLGYPARRDSRGQLYKPLFAFMVIGLNGKIPLNTAGNLAGPSSTHADHLGNSVSEVDPTYALQNGFDPTTNDPTFAFTSPPAPLPAGNLILPNLNLASNTQVDDAGIDVRLTQLRNLLSGTRPHAKPIPFPATDTTQYPQNNDPANGDDNYVLFTQGTNEQQLYFMPNGIAEVSPIDSSVAIGVDSNGNPVYYVARTNPPVAGRWGESQSIPGIPYANPSGGAPLNMVTSSGYHNAVRAGYSQDIGDALSNTPRDAADDNNNSFDPFPYGHNGELGDLDATDAAGALLLPIDRMRRFLTPVDINGTGSVRTWNPTSAGRGSNLGADSWGRVEYYSYFRPPGVPGVISVNYTVPGAADNPPNTNPVPISITGVNNNLGAVYYPSTTNEAFYQAGPNPNNIVGAAGSYPYLPDLTNNLLHGFETFKVPNLMSGYGGSNTNRPTTRPYDPQDFGGMPIDLPYPLPTPPIPTSYPTYDFQVNSTAKVRSDGLNEADEMNLYVRNAQLDTPFGPSDLEWLYRQQDIDGATLTSTLAQLAPISFTNGLDGQRRRRLFALDTWETNNFVWASDNPGGNFANNSRFNTTGTTSNASFLNAGTKLNGTYYTPSLAHRDKKINLNYPLPVSNDPNEPIRQKWIHDTYQLLKVILPPRAVDTPEELAQLSQFVINIIDFRDPDCTMTHFQNPDVNMVLGSITGTTYTPTVLVASNATLATGVVTYPLDQFGMEYNPIAINETMAYSFLYKMITGTTYTATPNNRFLLELVNTLTQANLPTGATVNPCTIDLGANNFDMVITTDDPVSRPDPFTGQLLPIATAKYYGPIPFVGTTGSGAQVYMSAANVTMTALSPSNGSTASPTFPTGYFNVIGNATSGGENTPPAPTQQLMPAFDPTNVGTNPTGTPQTPAPGALTLTATPAANGTLTIGKPNTYPAKPWMPQIGSKLETYYWVCLRRPASLFLPPNPVPNSVDPNRTTGPYNPMIVVDCMRFPYIEGGGTATPPTGSTTTTVSVTPGTNTIYSAQRAQPYRGGHAVRLPGDTGTGAAVLNTAYGYSEQTVAPFTKSNYGAFGPSQITQIPTGGATSGPTMYHTIGLTTGNDQKEPWDWFVFHDRDFSSVAELTLVPGCPPGLFTKQFVELPPLPPSTTSMVASGVYANFPVPSSTPPPPPNPPTVPSPISTAPAAPSAYTYSAAATGSALQPHTYPYLVDKFFYTGVSLAAPGTSPATYAKTDTANQSVNTPASDGWFRMFEFFEVPSQMIGAIGPVAQGTNFDWARQDSKPGLLNLNLIIDEEVFFSVVGRQTYTAPTTLPTTTDSFAQGLLNFDQFAAGSTAIPQVVSSAGAAGATGSYPLWLYGTSGGVMTADWINPNAATGTTGLGNNGLKAAFSQFLALRHGGNINANGTPLLFNFTGDRPFRSLSYPDIDYTVMRPATLNPGSTPGFNTYTGTAAGYATTTYTGDPGVRNPYIYPGSFASYVTASPPVVSPTPTAPTSTLTPGTLYSGLATPYVTLPEPVPARRLFQVPDAFGSGASSTSTTAPTIPPTTTTGMVTSPTPQSNASDSGDPFINVVPPTQTTTVNGTAISVAVGALPPIAVVSGTTTNTYYLNNGYPVLTKSGNAPTSAGSTTSTYLGSGTGGTDNRQHPAWRIELLQRVMNLTTVRTHQYAVWITIGFFELKKQGDINMLGLGSPQLAFDTIGAEVGALSGNNVRYRGFFLVDRLKLTGFDPANTGSFRSAVVYRKVIQ
jgi:hypothetical protein